MRITEQAYSFDSQSKNNFKTLQSIQWLGRTVVPYLALVGALAIIALVVKTILKHYTSISSRGVSPTTPLKMTAEEFCSRYQIDLNQGSSLIQEIQKIREEYEGWNETDSEVAWVSRLSTLRKHVGSLLNILKSMEQPEPWSSSYQTLDGVLKQFQDAKSDPGSAYKSFQKLMDDLLFIQVDLNDKFFAELQKKFQEIQIAKPSHPHLKSEDLKVADCLISLGIKTEMRCREILKCGQKVLEERGIATLKDLERLAIYRMDDDLAHLQCFHYFFNLYPPHLSISPAPAVGALRRFLNQLANKVREEKGRYHLANTEGFQNLSDHLIELLEAHCPDSRQECLEQLSEIIEFFKDWNLLRQQADLREYVR